MISSTATCAPAYCLASAWPCWVVPSWGLRILAGWIGNKLVVWVEIDRWLADAVEAVTGARLGKRTLKFLDYGKLAATFLNVETARAVRIVALESSRRLADLRHPEIEDKYERQMRTYREAAEEELFSVTDVEIQVRAKDLPGHPRSRVICSKCGDGVNDGREISLPDRITLCRPCVYGTYYQPKRLRGTTPTPGSPARQPGWGGAVREGSNTVDGESSLTVGLLPAAIKND